VISNKETTNKRSISVRQLHRPSIDVNNEENSMMAMIQGGDINNFFDTPEEDRQINNNMNEEDEIENLINDI
jgi:hypothetical protein